MCIRFYHHTRIRYFCTNPGGPPTSGLTSLAGAAVHDSSASSNSGNACRCPNGQIGDNNNCGSCGNVCNVAAGQTCQSGQCVDKCPTGQTRCNGQCVDPSSPSNCGDCGIVCASGQACQADSSAQFGFSCQQCPSGQDAVDGQCVAQCPPGAPGQHCTTTVGDTCQVGLPLRPCLCPHRMSFRLASGRVPEARSKLFHT